MAMVGCSSDDDPTDSTTTAPAVETTTTPSTTSVGPEGAVSLDRWAEGFCTDFSGWVTEVEKLGSDAEAEIEGAENEAEVKELATQMFDDAAVLVSGLIESTSTQPPPAMEDGDGVVDAFVEKFTAFQDLIEGSKAEVEQVDTASDTFVDDVKAVFADFEKQYVAIGQSFGDIDNAYPDPEFQAALSTACSL